MNPSKPRYGKALAMLIIGIIALFVIGGAQSVYVGLAVRQYDSVSPPQALLEPNAFYQHFGLYVRLFDVSALPHAWRMADRVELYILPLALLAAYIIACCVYARRSSKLKAALWISIGIVTALVCWAVCFIVIPGTMMWSAFQLMAYHDASHARALLASAHVETDQAAILEGVSAAHQLSIYADYGSGGALLALLLNERAGRQLTQYESFYLPLFFAWNKPQTGEAALDAAPVFLVNGSAVVFTGKGDTPALLKAVLPPIAKQVLTQAYGDHIAKSKNVLKTFSVLQGSDFQGFYDLKVTSDLQATIDENKTTLAKNEKFLADYPALLQQYDADYKRYVTDEETAYSEGCTFVIEFNDCDHMKQTIADNKAVMAQNKATLEEDRANAPLYDADIEAHIASDTEALNDFEDNKAGLENDKSEYSVGVMFDGDTIYLQYDPADPVNADLMRVAVHEMLHLYSYNPKEGFELPDPLNEGLTDYLATKALGYSDLDVIRSAGYPLEVQVVMALLEKIPREELLNAYFSQDEDAFKALMKRYFPNTDYNDFMARYQIIYDATFHLNGAYHDFSTTLIDHPDVQHIRLMLGLKATKFDHVNY